MKKGASKQLIVIMLVVLIFFWSALYKKNSDDTSQSVMMLDMQVEAFMQTFQTTENEILKVTIYNLYNYDNLAGSIKLQESQFETFERSAIFTTTSYPKTKQDLQELAQHHAIRTAQIETFLQHNGKIKNSLNFLIKSLGELDNLTQNEQIIATNTITSLIQIKNNMSLEALQSFKIDLGFMEKKSRNERLFNNRLKLFKTHVELLNTYLPEYIQLANTLLEDSKTQTLLTKLNTDLSAENAEMLQSLTLDFYIMVSFSIFALGVVWYYMNLSDAEEQRIAKLQKEYKDSTTTDTLTGLKNRTSYFERIDSKEQYSVILFDIVEFSSINNLYGMKIGDFILRGVANRLRLAVIELKGEVFKVGADQFLILLDELDEQKTQQIASYIIEYLENESYRHDEIEQSFFVQLTAGIAMNSPHLQNASLALRSLEHTNDKKIALFDESMYNHEEIANNIAMIQKLKYSLANDHIIPFFQPIVDLKDNNKIIKYEALVRMRDNNSYLSPYTFLTLSKKAKLYTQITHQVISKSIHIVEQQGIDVSINISIEDILHHPTHQYIIYELSLHRKLAPKITFELLESEEILDFLQVKNFIQEVKSYGCHIAIDDFGSGYSNYYYLLEMDIDILKIDGSLIKNIVNNESNQLVVKSIIEFAKLAEIKTVAEFVSSKEIEAKIKELGIDYAQGYLYSEPKLLS